MGYYQLFLEREKEREKEKEKKKMKKETHYKKKLEFYKNYYQENKEKVKQQSLDYYYRNRDEILKKNEVKRQDIKKYFNLWWEQNKDNYKENRSAYIKNYYKQNKVQIDQKNYIYYQNNKDKISAKRKVKRNKKNNYYDNSHIHDEPPCFTL